VYHEDETTNQICAQAEGASLRAMWGQTAPGQKTVQTLCRPDTPSQKEH